jgi:DUF4097 and DUF4098 domain-containing protein YvlB
MRRLLMVLLFALSASSLLVAEEWTKTYTLSGNPELRVGTSDASIHVTTWDRNTTEARVTTEGYKIGEGGLRIIEQQTGNKVSIEVKFPHETFFSFGYHNRHVEITVQMPRQGNANLRTSDGSISLSGLKGNMELNTSDGSLQIEGVDGSLRAHTSDGRITASGRFDSLSLNTSDGRIDATALTGSRLNGEWDLHTSDGSVTLRVPPTLAANVELRTGDGRIDFDVPITAQGAIGRNRISGKLNGGGNLLSVRTSDGSIRIGRS